MSRIIGMLLALAASADFCFGGQVLWASVAEIGWPHSNYDALVDTGGETVTVAQFFGGDISDAMYRIVLPESGRFLDIYLGNGEWDEFGGEFGVEMVDSGESGYLYGHYTPFNAEGIEDDELVRMEIGLYVYNPQIDDWDVNIMAVSDDVAFGDLKGRHTSDDPIPPQDFVDWMPTTFYAQAPVPEPSVVCLAVLGLVVMLGGGRRI